MDTSNKNNTKHTDMTCRYDRDCVKICISSADSKKGTLLPDQTGIWDTGGVEGPGPMGVGCW